MALVHPPRGGGGARHCLVPKKTCLVPKKNVLLPYCTGLCHRDTSLSEIRVTCFVLTLALLRPLKKLEAPTVAKSAPKPAAKRGKQAAAKPAAASASIPVADGEHMQLFKTLWDLKRKFYTVPVQNKGHAQN